MVKKMVLDCPSCQKRCDIFLSANASILLINCPFCGKPLLFYRHTSFQLSTEQLEDIQQHCKENSLADMLKKIAHNSLSALPAPVPVKKSKRTRPKCDRALVACGVARRPGREEKYICRDDITNLRITLETCPDVQRFIEVL
ncbi:MAG: hypothetical protein PHC61_02400 [Chitinivibrionales bacterium]|nr:hypothetical protein [Chitinivibrionales bacterium]